MNRKSYIQSAIKFSFTASQDSELPKQQELNDYLFGQILCPPDSIYQKGAQLVLETCNISGYIEFSFTSEQISGQADTSLAGPGFHRAVVLLLDQLGKEYGMSLILTDASGFYTDRDFERIQNHYTEQLFETLREFAARGELSAFGEKGYLDKDKLLPSIQGIDIRPIREEEILTPMGAFSSEYIRTLVTKEEQRKFASEYFLWFTSEQGEQYERNLITYEAWNRQVDFEQGTNYYSNSSRIGYRNGILLHTLPGGWVIPLPGAYEAEFNYDEEERETYPVYFILEKQQIRFLYTYTTDLEEWKNRNGDFKVIDNGKYYISDGFQTERVENYFWSGEIMMEGQALVMEAEGQPEISMNHIEKMILGIYPKKR